MFVYLGPGLGGGILAVISGISAKAVLRHDEEENQ